MLQAGIGTINIARQLGTSVRTIRCLLERFNTTGETQGSTKKRRSAYKDDMQPR